MSKPVEAIALAINSHEGVLKPSLIARKNSKPGIRKKGSSNSLSQNSSTTSLPDDPTSTSPSALNSSQDTIPGDALSVGSPTLLTSSSGSGLGVGRKVRGAGKLKLSTNADDEDSLKSSDPISPRAKAVPYISEVPISSPRAGPHYQAAIAADPSLSYVPMRVFVTTDVSFVASQSNAGSSPSTTGAPRPLEFVALSVGRLWNLTTLLLIAGEKMGLPAHALFLKTRIARVLSIHDLREDDELILCQHVEGPFALLAKDSSSASSIVAPSSPAQPFVRLSPRSRLASPLFLPMPRRLPPLLPLKPEQPLPSPPSQIRLPNRPDHALRAPLSPPVTALSTNPPLLSPRTLNSSPRAALPNHSLLKDARNLALWSLPSPPTILPATHPLLPRNPLASSSLTLLRPLHPHLRAAAALAQALIPSTALFPRLPSYASLV